MVKSLPATAGAVREAGLMPGGGYPLEEGLATHFSILAWRLAWTEEPGVL